MLQRDRNRRSTENLSSCCLSCVDGYESLAVVQKAQEYKNKCTRSDSRPIYLHVLSQKGRKTDADMKRISLSNIFPEYSPSFQQFAADRLPE